MRLTNTLAFVFVLFAFSQALANRHSLSDFKEEKDTLLLNNMHVEGGAIVVDYSAAKHFPEKNNEKEIVKKGISQSKLIKEKSKKLLICHACGGGSAHSASYPKQFSAENPSVASGFGSSLMRSLT